MRHCFAHILFGTVLSFTMTTIALAQLQVSSMFGDHMVFQRDRPVRVWGTAGAGELVSVSIRNRTAQAITGADGKWSVLLKPVSAGGPHTLRVESASGFVEFRDVLAGDVYLCSGQSNMQWPLRSCPDNERNDALAQLTDKLRLYQFPKEGKDTPLSRTDVQWKVATREDALGFSAVGLLFGLDIMGHEDVPVGLIDSSFGGTVVEAWTSAEMLATMPDVPIRDSLFGWKPSSMYNAMIAPVHPFTMQGVLWYQGESNAVTPAHYRRQFEAMIGDWRTRFENPTLPFFVVQLPSFADPIGPYHFTWIREAQAQVAKEVPGVCLAVTLDTHEGWDLHPKPKREIAHRLALHARRHVYGRKIECESPQMRSVSASGEKIVVQFDHAKGLKTTDGKPPKGFAVAGEDGVFRFAEATIRKDTVELINREVSVPAMNCRSVLGPLKVRYAMEGNPDVNLVNGTGLPAMPFRTDNLEIVDIEAERMPAPYRIGLRDAEAIVDGDGALASVRVR